jgi:ApbE superfamily uncharacterized protein (UPF0280 family)
MRPSSVAGAKGAIAQVLDFDSCNRRKPLSKKARRLKRWNDRADLRRLADVLQPDALLFGEELLEYSADIIIENGGDIYVRSTQDRIIGIYAGDSPLSGKLGIEITPKETPCGICTSSGTVGHSLSFGKADAVTILARSAIVADAVATACGNIVQNPGDIEKGLDLVTKAGDVTGAVIIIGDRVGVCGAVRLKRL